MVKETLAAFGLVVILVGCAGFSFKNYGLDLPDYSQGKLLGPTEADDLPITVCKPDELVKGKCVVMLATDFFRLKQDYEETKQRLKECQSQ